MWYVIREDELYHHGILGQKWGVRRFQNPDGSLTAAGQKRYGVDGEDGTGAHKKKINGKKIAVAAGVTVAAAVGVGLAVKYRKEIGAALAKKGSIAVGRLLTADRTPVEEFVQGQKKRVGDAISKGIEGASGEITRATLVGAAGIATAKIAERKTAADQANGENFVRNVLNSVGNKGIDDFVDSLGRTPNSSSNNGKSGSNGGTVGKEVSDKLGKPANRGTFTTDEMTRYNQIHQDNRVKNNADAKATVKALKKNGYSIEQIEQYVKNL